MDYDYNRAAFRSVCQVPGVQPLALAYCSCVLLELSLKQHLSLVSSTTNLGHNLPQLLQRFGNQNRRHLTVCNSLQKQLSDALAKLFSQSKNGAPLKVPSKSYPYLRYLRHSTDWTSSCSPEADIRDLLSLVQRVIHFLKGNARVSV